MKIEIDHATVAFPPAPAREQADFAPKPEGLKLLFAASQIETNPEDKDADANGAEAQAEAPSSSTVVSNGTVAGAVDLDLESGSGREAAEAGIAEAASPHPHNDSETENLAITAIENQEKSFPQILHEILATTECQSILHWLPDGFSFIIADKQRFSSEILPEYFRGALSNSFIRKLNRWGFRRVKSRSKGEESSFAHKNFVQDKPWLCLKMMCKSKPTYHKVPSAMTTKKKKAKQKSTAAAAAEASNSKSLVTHAGIVVATKAPPLFLATSGMMNRAFIPTITRMAVSEYELLPLPNPTRNPTLPKVPAPAVPARFLSTADASAIEERHHQHQHQHLAHHQQQQQQQQQRIFYERQILIAQMRQRHQLQVELELQRLNEMSAQVGEHFNFTSSHNVQRAMTMMMVANYSRDSDMLRSRNIHYTGERK